MKAEQNGTIVDLRAENPDEQRLLDAFWERGVRVCAGGSRLGISLPGFYYVLELNEEQVMALMHLLGTGREQERSVITGLLMRKGNPLEVANEIDNVSLIIRYQDILEEVLRSMKRRDGGATMGFTSRAFVQPPPQTITPEPVIIAEDRLKEHRPSMAIVGPLTFPTQQYITDGVNDHVEVNAAIEMAASFPGTEVFVLNETDLSKVTIPEGFELEKIPTGHMIRRVKKND